MQDIIINQVRDFNRFYTNFLGIVNRYILGSSYSLPEARILFEINRKKKVSAAEIVKLLQIDKGYLSRILTNFEKKGLTKRVISELDGRVYLTSLTTSGRKEFSAIDQASADHINRMISQLDHEERVELLAAMQTIKSLLSRVGSET
ncbi:MAG: winged helix-turn-helix transcriptional regulator [Saprospiraceae bacterium]|nr:winged helix-turn-helix transcriptional regulator [Saprospiraceae bacterium]